MPRKYRGTRHDSPDGARGFNEAGADAPEIPAPLALGLWLGVSTVFASSTSFQPGLVIKNWFVVSWPLLLPCF